jgi:ABC-2 type transport system ATP-binding protein
MNHSMNHLANDGANVLCQFDSVSKWYGPVIGLNDATLQIEAGITGLVGHNGAGKSTLIKLLTGQLRPSLGAVRVCGHSAWSAVAKRRIGYCPDVNAFYEEMSGRDFVRMIARLHGFSRRVARARTEEVLQQVGMTDRAQRPLGSYSKGMRQRIKLAQALVHDPELIVLDEPLNGVDPVGRLEMIQVFRELAAKGKAILVSSHILDEMDTLADRILFIVHGRILAAGTLQQIRAMLDDYPLKIRITTKRARQFAACLLELDMVLAAELHPPDELRLQVQRPKDFFAQLPKLIDQHQFNLERMQVIDASTEAVFDYLMQAAVPSAMYDKQKG